jgi:Acyl-CoA synthetases (AMP-forming)/AMP-acid ligases II
MAEMLIHDAKSAYKYPLLIKQLWHAPLVQAPDQVIVYRDMKRFTYRQLRERIGRLASSLARLGVGAATPFGVLDWDSNRFLEAYFAVPMMGAVLQTVNVRLPPNGSRIRSITRARRYFSSTMNSYRRWKVSKTNCPR